MIMIVENAFVFSFILRFKFESIPNVIENNSYKRWLVKKFITFILRAKS